MSAVLELQGLARSWDGKPALRGLGLSLLAGGTLGLIGPDGAGKTTAMRMACGLLRPDAGQARIMGHDCLRQSAAIRPLLGYMPQRFSLYPDLSVDENLRFFSELHGLDRSRRLRQRERLLAFSRLEPFTRRRAGALSGGMKQKLALACTLLHEPRLLILDEPTTGVDPVSRQEFWALLGELARGGMALWVSTPYMDEAERCQHIQLLHEGRVIAEGPPSAVAAAFPRRILRLEGADPARVKALLEPYHGVVAHRFGHNLHLVCDSAQVEALRHRLAQAGMDAQDQPATLEDAFFHAVATATSAGEAAA